MNGIHTVTLATSKPDSLTPKMILFADWLIPMGFVPDSLVQFLPEENGMSFTLCENIPKYSALAQATRAQGGTFAKIHLYKYRINASLGISGTILQKIGLACGDTMLVRYEFGFIQMRKLPGNTRVVTARLFGHWLEDLGFSAGESLTVDSSPNLITCQLHENGLARTHELVKFARQNKLNLLQVAAQKDNNDAPNFTIPIPRLEKAGFSPSDSFLATCEHGSIILQPINFEALGFNGATH